MSRLTDVYFYDLTLIAVGDQIIQSDQGTSTHKTADNNSR